MSPDAKIYVAGHAGLAGSAITRALRRQGYENLICRTHAELDLTQQREVREFFSAMRPEYVFLAAGKVGGIVANNTYPADFIADNLSIQTNIIHEAWRVGVKRLLFLGSSCIYPRDCPQPIRENYLLTGPLEPTNRAYAVAKIAGVEMCRAYNQQHGTQYLAAMPTNMYGPGDNYDLENSHVLPALIRKMHDAKVTGAPEVMIWGSGKPRREFLYSDDLGAACVFLMALAEKEFQTLVDPASGQPPLINIGCGEDQTILDLATLVRDVVGYGGAFAFDRSRPDGTFQKLLSSERMRSLGWQPQVSLKEGIARAYADFLKRAG